MGSWKLIRLLMVVAVAVFALSRFLTLAPLMHSPYGGGMKTSAVKGTPGAVGDALGGEAIRLEKISENQGTERFQDPAFYHGQTGTLSGGHVEDDLDDKDSLDRLEYAQPGEHPKVALMFLTKGAVHNELIWRSFLEGAARLKLKVPAVKPPPVNLEQVIGGPLHPSVPALDESRYPGYKIQHGLVPPSKYRSTSYPHVKKRRLLEEDINVEKEEVANVTVGNITVTSPEETVGVNSTLAHEKKSGGKDKTGDKKKKKNGIEGVLGCPAEREMLEKESKRLLNTSFYGPDLYKSQDLFSIYVHAQPGYTFPANSLFSGLQIADPVNCTNAFALHTLVLAELKLLTEALKDPRNQKFVLLSEACVPVHPPEVVYAQSLFETKSRIHACVSKDPGRLELWRWKKKMKTSHLDQQHWRKSQQWFILNRAHAELVVEDQHVKEVFKRYCWSYGKHICVSDEHYIPTLLASYHLDDQTDCLGTGTWTDWGVEGWHPGTFTRDDVNIPLFDRILNGAWPPCDPVIARRTALELFDFKMSGDGNADLSHQCLDTSADGKSFNRQFKREFGASLDDWITGAGYAPLGYECPLFARKFAPDALMYTMNSTLSCLGGGQGHWCRESLLAAHPEIIV